MVTTHIHTESCLASTFSCLEQAGRSQITLDQTEFVQKVETTLSCIFLVVCLS